MNPAIETEEENVKTWLKGAIAILAIPFLLGVAVERMPFAGQLGERFVRAPVGQPQVRPMRELIVVDSKGKVLGATIGGVGINLTETIGPMEFRPAVLLQVGHEVATIQVGRDRFYGGNLFFDSPNCTGTAWFPVEPFSGAPSPLVPQSAIGPPGQTLYLQSTDAAPQVINVKSLLVGSLRCHSQDFPLNSFPARALVNLETVFTPPFSLKALP